MTECGVVSLPACCSGCCNGESGSDRLPTQSLLKFQLLHSGSCDNWKFSMQSMANMAKQGKAWRSKARQSMKAMAWHAGITCKGGVHLAGKVAADADIDWLAVSDCSCHCCIQQAMCVLQMHNLRLHYQQTQSHRPLCLG